MTSVAVLEMRADVADPPDFVVRFKDLATFWQANSPFLGAFDEMMDRAHRETGARMVRIVHPRFGAIMGKTYEEG